MPVDDDKPAKPVPNRTALYALIGTVLAAFISSTAVVLAVLLPQLWTIEHATNSQLTDLNRRLADAVAALDTQGAVIVGLRDLIEEIRNPTAPLVPVPPVGGTP